MPVCHLCNNQYKNINGLSKHITYSHPSITKEAYYRLYINITNDICNECNNTTTFRGLGVGFLDYCSHECYSKAVKTSLNRRSLASGRIQSQETIDKRIANTNQIEKQKTNKATILAKYGVENVSQVLEIADKIGRSGVVKTRSKIHQHNIIKSKRINNTLKHSIETKLKISKSVRKIYASDNAPITISDNVNKNHVTGYINNIFYRSSYEQKFLVWCNINNIDIISAENKNFRIRYYDDDNTPRFYYPDFYLKEKGIIVEIKPLSMLEYKNNQIKIDAAYSEYSYTLVTEEELDNLDEWYKYL